MCISQKYLWLFKFWKCHSFLSAIFVKCQSKTKKVYLLLYIVGWARVMTVLKLSSKNLKNYFPISQKWTDFTIIVCDFNVRSSTWGSGDTTTTEGTNIEELTYHRFEQVIDEPTNILPNSTSSIDLIFADKPNFIVENSAFLSLHVKFHHQIVYSKLNFNVVYPPPYKRLVWDYKKANVDCIRKYLKFLVKTFISKLNIWMKY